MSRRNRSQKSDSKVPKQKNVVKLRPSLEKAVLKSISPKHEPKLSAEAQNMKSFAGWDKASFAKKPVPTKQKQLRSGITVSNKNGATNQIISIQRSAQQTCVFNVVAQMPVNSLALTVISFASYLAQKGVFSNTASQGLSPSEDPSVYYDGLQYLLQAIGVMIQGGTVTVKDVPRNFHILMNALSPATIPFHRAKASYAWSPFDSTAPSIGQAQIAGRTWNPTWIPEDSDTGAYNDLATVANPTATNPEAYSRLLESIGEVSDNYFTKIIPYGSDKTLLPDVSAFARNFRYNGLTPLNTPGSGVYCDVENEVQIRAPLFSHFVDYVQPDVRAPRYLAVTSGDAGFSSSACLLPFFSSFKNKVPPIIKQIDFEEIYTLVTLWMCKLKTAMSQTIDTINPTDEALQPLPMTQQDFRIVLRQALLTMFDTQFLTQFSSYIQYDGSTNCFVPFLVQGHTYGNSLFNQFRLPTLIVENLAALRVRAIDIQGKSKSNQQVIIPVLGNYILDTPTIPTFSKFVDGVEVSTNLFTPDLTQGNINLQDGYISSSPGGPVNLNGTWYQGRMEDWNFHVTTLSQVSCTTQTLASDSGAVGNTALFLTRVETFNPASVVFAKKTAARLLDLKYLGNSPELVTIANKQHEVLVRQNSKGTIKPLVIPPASVALMTNQQMLSAIPLTTELESYYNFMIIPVVRTNLTEDALTVPMYQVETGEGLSTFYQSSTADAGVSMYAKLADYASVCVPGTARADNDYYSRIIDMLQDKGHAGMIGSLLGGIVKGIIPGSSGIVDTVAALCPF